MEFVIGGIAATSAGLFTNPLEVVKHHMELSQKSQMNKCRTFFHTGLQVAKHDGLKSLQKGLSPALGAYLVSYGMKLGEKLYWFHVFIMAKLATDSFDDVTKSFFFSTIFVFKCFLYITQDVTVRTETYYKESYFNMKTSRNRGFKSLRI